MKRDLNSLNPEKFEDLKKGILDEHPGVRAGYEAEAFSAKVRRALKALRKSLHLSQEHVAEEMGITQPVVSRIENEHAGDMTLDTLYRYTQACRTRVRLSFDSIEDNQADPDVSDFASKMYHFVEGKKGFEADERFVALLERIREFEPDDPFVGVATLTALTAESASEMAIYKVLQRLTMASIARKYGRMVVE